MIWVLKYWLISLSGIALYLKIKSTFLLWTSDAVRWWRPFEERLKPEPGTWHIFITQTGFNHGNTWEAQIQFNAIKSVLFEENCYY